MVNEFQGIMAAPNQCEIKAKLLILKQSPNFSDKWLADIEILESKEVRGPNFARVGKQFKAFTFESTSNLAPGCTISAQAEYLGDAQGGQFQLMGIEVLDQKPE